MDLHCGLLRDEGVLLRLLTRLSILDSTSSFKQRRSLLQLPT